MKTPTSHPIRAERWAAGLGLALACASVSAHCVIAGSEDARVRVDDRLRVPVFTMRDCSQARLVEGTAQAIWTARDGRTVRSALRPDGPPDGYDMQNSKAHSARLQTLLSTLIGARTGSALGVVRSVMTEQVPYAVLPSSQDLALPLFRDMPRQYTLFDTDTRRTVWEGRFKPGDAAVLPASVFSKGSAWRLEWQVGTQTGFWRLQAVTPEHRQALAQNLTALPEASAASAAERAWARAVLYERHGATFNALMALASIGAP